MKIKKFLKIVKIMVIKKIWKISKIMEIMKIMKIVTSMTIMTIMTIRTSWPFDPMWRPNADLFCAPHCDHTMTIRDTTILVAAFLAVFSVWPRPRGPVASHWLHSGFTVASQWLHEKTWLGTRIVGWNR